MSTLKVPVQQNCFSTVPIYMLLLVVQADAIDSHLGLLFLGPIEAFRQRAAAAAAAAEAAVPAWALLPY